MKTLHILLAFAILGCASLFADQAWITGTPKVENGVLLFKTDAGPTYKMGTTKTATELLSALQACAQKGTAIRAYGDVYATDEIPPNYTGPKLPAKSFIVWKLHLPNEKDTFDQQPTSHVPKTPPNKSPTSHVPKTPESRPNTQLQTNPGFFNVEKGSTLRSQVIRGLLRAAYLGNEKLARSNPNNIQFVLGTCICDGKTVAVKVAGGTGKAAVANPIPILVILRPDGAGNWVVVNEYTSITPAQRSALIAAGLPAGLF